MGKRCATGSPIFLWRTWIHAPQKYFCGAPLNGAPQNVNLPISLSGVVIAPKSLTVTWLTLLIFFQKSTSQVSWELSQLKEEMATSKANFKKKVKDLEASLAKAASENSELKKSLEKQEED